MLADNRNADAFLPKNASVVLVRYLWQASDSDSSKLTAPHPSTDTPADLIALSLWHSAPAHVWQMRLPLFCGHLFDHLDLQITFGN